MFIRASTVLFSVIALAGVATAGPSALDVRSFYRCEPLGSIPQCCGGIQPYDSPFVTDLWGYFGYPTPPSGMIGIGCSPIDTSGTTAIYCPQLPACCGPPFNGISTECIAL